MNLASVTGLQTGAQGSVPKVSIVVAAFNAASTIAATLQSLRLQRFRDFEVIVVDDGSTDRTAIMVQPFLALPRFRLIQQANRGTAGARNSGILAARGTYVGFCDAKTIWCPDKLQRHVTHLEANPDVGLSFAGACALSKSRQWPFDRDRHPVGHVTVGQLLRHSAFDAGAAPVVRATALQSLRFMPFARDLRPWVFDETFRQSDDLECALRLALTTDWQIEGIRGRPVQILGPDQPESDHSLRAMDSWERMVAKLRPLAPAVFARHEGGARVHHLRQLARGAARHGAYRRALRLGRAALRPCSPRPAPPR